MIVEDVVKKRRKSCITVTFAWNPKKAMCMSHINNIYTKGIR